MNQQQQERKLHHREDEEKDHSMVVVARAQCHLLNDNESEKQSSTNRSSTCVTTLPSSSESSSTSRPKQQQQQHNIETTPQKEQLSISSKPSATPTQRKRRSNEMSGKCSPRECTSSPQPSPLPPPPFPASSSHAVKKMRSPLITRTHTHTHPSRPKHHHDQSSLAFLCLSKSWIAATRRAQTHPKEVEYGCTSSARKLLPLNQEQKPNQMMSNSMASSPLALACRYGAPSECVRAILDANPSMVRRCIPNRGTPIHEAIMLLRNDDSFMEYVAVIRMLLVADENLPVNESSGGGKRATLMQDVDGSVPLHLLVRQAFYAYLVGTGTNDIAGRENNESDLLERDLNEEDTQEHPLLGIIRDLIESSPEAVAIQDCTQYEETPLILALKSSAHANEMLFHNSDASDAMQSECNAELERRIFDITKIMLTSYPAAASLVSVRSGYTAVHSAVFHGRCSDTIRLVLNADWIHRKELVKINGDACSPISAAMRPNSMGELPLHFASMRGECTRSVALLSQAAPWAVLERDQRFGMTPLHWLWVRFVDTIYERFGESSFQQDTQVMRNATETNADGAVVTNSEAAHPHGLEDTERSSLFSSFPVELFSQSTSLVSKNKDMNFDLEYHIRTGAIDPPVDFTRMRHIPLHLAIEDFIVDRVMTVLKRVKKLHGEIVETTLKELKTKTSDVKKGRICPHFGTDDIQREESPKENTKGLPNVCHGSEKELVNGFEETHMGSTFVTEGLQQLEFNEKIDSIRRCPFVYDSYPVKTHGVSIEKEEDNIREEQVISLFWAKVTPLLKAASMAQNIDRSCTIFNPMHAIDDDNIFILHAACSASCSPRAIVRLCMELYPEQLQIRDQYGKLPLHYAASRNWDSRELAEFETLPEEVDATGPVVHSSESSISSRIENDNVIIEGSIPEVPNLIANESSRILGMILAESAPNAARTYDKNNRLPLHCAIDTSLKAVMIQSQYSPVMNALQNLIDAFPEALYRRDGLTGLYPFMQVASSGINTRTERMNANSDENDKEESSCTAVMSLIYTILRETPSIVST